MSELKDKAIQLIFTVASNVIIFTVLLIVFGIIGSFSNVYIPVIVATLLIIAQSQTHIQKIYFCLFKKELI